MEDPKHPPVKKIVKFRSKVKRHEALTSALDGKVKPENHINKLAPVEVKRGAKPAVVNNFDEDDRSDNMAIYLGQGLTVEEAGILAGYSPEELKQLQERSEQYRKFVELQTIKFKQKHLKVINDKSDPKTSQWLLEQKFPEQYGKKASPMGGGVGSTQVIQAIVKSVQMTTDQPVVHEYENPEEESEGYNEQPASRGAEPSLNPGGANILQ